MWDHKIDMKEDFEPKSFKNYNLTPEEQKEHSGKRIYSTITISHGFSLLLCQKEGWETMTLPRLLILK